SAPASRQARSSQHLPTPRELESVLQREAEVLWRRFDRDRYQHDFRRRARAIAATYIVRALRELGDTAMATPGLADRVTVVTQFQRWLRLMLKELTPEELASAHDAKALWRESWKEYPEYHIEASLLRACGEHLPAVLRGELDPLNLLFPEGAVTYAEHLYGDSLTFRVANLLVQK